MIKLNEMIHYILNPKSMLLKLDNRRIITLNDKKYLNIVYENAFNKTINWNNPQTFNEKLQWLKLYDRNPEYTKMVDKYEAKKYVADIIGEEYIIPTLGVWERFENINFEELPNQFVLKCTHDSGGLVICKDKKEFNIDKARRKINECMKKNYYYAGREWPYKNVEPRIIAEKYMVEENSEELKDYKFLCFNGKVKCSFVCTERYSKEGLKVTFFDLDWNRMPFQRHYPASEKPINKPINYEQMIQISETLSKNVPFVRVDLYEINNKVYFGELTFFPGCGFEEFTPEDWDKKLGDWIQLPDIKLEESYEK
ncbi:MAG: glycosyl transferase [Clostridia bacterium]|nr:glycosyl transferase [Clostridia bacterium]